MAQVMQATCPGCKTALRIPAEWANQVTRCKRCGMTFQLKVQAAPPPPPGASSQTPAPPPRPANAAPPSRPVKKPAGVKPAAASVPVARADSDPSRTCPPPTGSPTPNATSRERCWTKK